MAKITSAEHYIEVHEKFSDALVVLRDIITSTNLAESIKWNSPVYDLNGKNVLGLSAFKNHFGIWFFNGVFLNDKNKLLVSAQENKTKALRQMRFNKIEDIDKEIVLNYINEAIENQRLGKVLKANKTTHKNIIIPSELKDEFDANSSLAESFKQLTLGKQREYCEYIDSAKRNATKLTRINKIKPMILENVGLNDKYKNC